MGVLCTWVKLLNRFADFGLCIAQKCVWRPGWNGLLPVYDLSERLGINAKRNHQGPIVVYAASSEKARSGIFLFKFGIPAMGGHRPVLPVKYAADNMLPVTINVVWSVRLCLLVITVSPTKTTEPIVMPFGVWTWVAPYKVEYVKFSHQPLTQFSCGARMNGWLVS